MATRQVSATNVNFVPLFPLLLKVLPIEKQLMTRRKEGYDHVLSILQRQTNGSIQNGVST